MNFQSANDIRLVHLFGHSGIISDRKGNCLFQSTICFCLSCWWHWWDRPDQENSGQKFKTSLSFQVWQRMQMTIPVDDQSIIRWKYWIMGGSRISAGIPMLMGLKASGLILWIWCVFGATWSSGQYVHLSWRRSKRNQHRQRTIQIQVDINNLLNCIHKSLFSHMISLGQQCHNILLDYRSQWVWDECNWAQVNVSKLHP